MQEAAIRPKLLHESNTKIKQERHVEIAKISAVFIKQQTNKRGKNVIQTLNHIHAQKRLAATIENGKHRNLIKQPEDFLEKRYNTECCEYTVCSIHLNSLRDKNTHYK